MHDREHVAVAWAEAWPFVSEVAFSRRVVALSVDRPDAATTALTEELHAWLRPRLRGQSLDGLEQVRRLAWQREQPQRGAIRLGELLTEVAGRYLELDGAVARLRGRDGDRTDDRAAHARRWRWLSLALPVDLLVAALHARHKLEPLADDVALVPPYVARLLDEGYAETHLHAGGSFDFATLWTSWIASPELGKGRPSGPCATPEESARRTWAAAVVRLVLAAYLAARERGERRRLEAWLREYVSSIPPPSGFTVREPEEWICRALRVFLCREPEPFSLSTAAMFYMRWSGVKAPPRGDSGLATTWIACADPLSAWLPPRQGAMPETRFTARALRLLATEEDPLFAQLWWQYVRVRVATYRHLTIEPGTAGLGWFRIYFRRVDRYRARLDPRLAEIATEHAGTGVRALELRIQPPSSRQDLLRVATQVARAARAQRQRRTMVGEAVPELGLVLHWLKRLKDPEAVPRFAAWQRDAMKRVRALTWCLEAYPALMLVLRGIDVAGAELDVPTWVTVRPLREAREAGRRAARVLAEPWPDWHAAPFGLTYHAGEEYRRLTGGLRRIHELIEQGLLTTGDRLGHALALADDPTRFADRNAVVHQPREDRLADLLFELDRYASGELGQAEGRLELVRTEALTHLSKLYAFDATQRELDLARVVRRELPTRAEAAGFPNRTDWRSALVGGPSASSLLAGVIADAGVIARAREPVAVRTNDGETRMWKDLQRVLRLGLARMQVTVESNPTSNHLIADLDGIDQHPALRLQPMRDTGQDETVMVSINSDNPLTFASTLPDEYAHLFAALLRAGVSTQDALSWMDRVRQNGLRSRFTLVASARAGPIDALLAQIEPDRRGL